MAAELPYPYSLDVLDSVQIPSAPVDNHWMVDTALGFIIGGFAGFGIALALEYFRQPEAVALNEETDVSQGFPWREQVS